MKPLACSISLLILLALGPIARAQAVNGAPPTIDYQGQVLDSAGMVLAPEEATNYTMQFRIYDQQAGGSIIWAESQVVTVDKGVFSVRLGSGVPIPSVTGGSEGVTRDLRQAFNQTGRYLGLTVVKDVIPGQSSVEITPRLAFLSSPYAMVAERSKSADSAASAGVASSVIQNSGTSTLGATTITNFTLTGPGAVAGNNVLEFGSGVTGKQFDAGKIGYGTLSGGASLDIVGAGTAPANRKIKMFAEGGLTVTGPVTATAFIGDGSGLTGLTGSVSDGSVTLAKLAPDSVDLTKLVAAVKEALCPPGTIVAYGGTAAPAGWILCDGRSLNQTDPVYDALYAAIGKNFGGAATSFNVPDLQGRFLRGSDNGAERDPDAGTRTAIRSGGAVGDNVGSLQLDALRAHAHPYQDGYHAENLGGYSAGLPGGISTATLPKMSAAQGGIGSGGNTDDDNNLYQWARTTTATGGAETRPTNVSVSYIIKY